MAILLVYDIKTMEYPLDNTCIRKKAYKIINRIVGKNTHVCDHDGENSVSK